MLRSRKPAFRPSPYGYSRRKRRIPRWLMLMLVGIVIGVGGVLFVQESYGPARLTVEESERLHFDLNAATSEVQRLKTELGQSQRELEQAQQKLTEQSEQIKEHDAIVAQLEKDIAFFARNAPEDPRGTSPGIRAAQFRHQTDGNGGLAYELLLMQDDPDAEEFIGTLNFNVMGRYPNGRTGYIDLDPIPVVLGYYLHADGITELPSGFTPRQVTVQIKPEDSEKVVATRILNVR